MKFSVKFSEREKNIQILQSSERVFVCEQIKTSDVFYVDGDTIHSITLGRQDSPLHDPKKKYKPNAILIK